MYCARRCAANHERERISESGEWKRRPRGGTRHRGLLGEAAMLTWLCCCDSDDSAECRTASVLTAVTQCQGSLVSESIIYTVQGHINKPVVISILDSGGSPCSGCFGSTSIHCPSSARCLAPVPPPTLHHRCPVLSLPFQCVCYPCLGAVDALWRSLSLRCCMASMSQWLILTPPITDSGSSSPLSPCRTNVMSTTSD